MGHFREAEGEVLVAGIVPGRASVRDDLRELSDALSSPTPGRASPYVPSDHPLQVDGRSGDDADGSRTDAVSGPSAGRPDEPGGRPSPAEQDDRGRMSVPDRGCDMPVRVRREDRG